MPLFVAIEVTVPVVGVGIFKVLLLNVAAPLPVVVKVTAPWYWGIFKAPEVIVAAPLVPVVVNEVMGKVSDNVVPERLRPLPAAKPKLESDGVGIFKVVPLTEAAPVPVVVSETRPLLLIVPLEIEMPVPMPVTGNVSDMVLPEIEIPVPGTNAPPPVLVTQVGHAIVPVPVIVPPVIGPVVATLVTVPPLPAAVSVVPVSVSPLPSVIS